MFKPGDKIICIGGTALPENIGKIAEVLGPFDGKSGELYKGSTWLKCDIIVKSLSSNLVTIVTFTSGETRYNKHSRCPADSANWRKLEDLGPEEIEVSKDLYEPA